MKKFTVVVPVYKNEESIDRLLDEVTKLAEQMAELGFELELVTVVDGSPDQSYSMIRARLTDLPFSCSLVCLLYTSPSPRDLSTARMPSSA